MPPRARRDNAAAATGGDAAAAAAAAAAPPAPAAASAHSGGAAAGAKRKAAGASAAKQEPAVKQEDGNAAATQGGAAAGSKANRRVAKRAKHEAADVAAEKAAEKAAAAAARPAATQRKAEKRARVSTAKREEKAAEERQLEAFLFGHDDALLLDAAATTAQQPAQRATTGAASTAAAGETDGAAAPAFAFEVDTSGAGEGAAAGGEGEGEEAAASNRRKKQRAKKEAKDEEEEEAAASGPQAAWADEDDAEENTRLIDLSLAPRLRKLKAHPDERFITGAEYNRRLRALFQEMNPGTATWATAKEETADDADISTLLLQAAASGGTAGVGGTGREPGGAGRGEPLPPTTLDVLRLRDANLAEPCASVVSSVRFHPQGQLLLTGGMDKMVRIFQVDGHANAKVQGVWLDDMPVLSAEWLPSRSGGVAGSVSSGEIIATGRRQHFYSIDVSSGSVSRIAGVRGRDDKSLEKMTVSPCGRWIAIVGNDGYTLLLDARTKQLAGTTKQNGSVRSVSFSADGEYMFSIGGEGCLYVWHTASRKCVFKHADEGNISGTALAVGGAASFGSGEGAHGMYALGSDSGVVNLYHTSQLSNALSHRSALASAGGLSARLTASSSLPPPTPLKSLMHLTTPVDYLRFNHDASLLLMASRRKKDALKLVHTASQTVFANWPTSSTPLHYVSSVDFSPNSGYMAIGNDRGRVLLYRLTHYPRA